MNIECRYNIEDRRWEWLFLYKDKYVAGYVLENLSEADKVRYLVSWLNSCFRQIQNEQETSK